MTPTGQSPVPSDLPHGRFIVKLCAMWSLVIMCSSMKGITLPLLLDSFLTTAEASRWQGYFGTITGLSGFVFCSLLGFLSDVHGRQRVLIPWLFVFVAAGVIDTACWFYRSVYLLASARLCAVVIGSTLVAAITSDHYSGRQLLRVQGLIGASFGASLILGAVTVVVVSTLFTPDKARLVCFLIANALSVIALIIGTNLHPPASEWHHIELHSHLMAKEAPPSNLGRCRKTLWIIKAICKRGLAVLRRVSADPFLHGLVWVFALLKVINMTTQVIYVLYVKYRYDWKMDMVGIAMAIYGLCGIFYQTLGIKALAHCHVPTYKALMAIAVAFPLMTLSFGLASTGTQMFICISVGSVSGVFGSLFSSKLVMIASKDGMAGLCMGLVGSLQNALEIPFAAIMGNLLAYAVDHFEPGSMAAGFPYYIIGGCAVIPVVLLIVLDRRYGSRDGWRGETVVFASRVAPDSKNASFVAAAGTECCDASDGGIRVVARLSQEMEPRGSVSPAANHASHHNRTASDDMEVTVITGPALHTETPRPRTSYHHSRSATPRQ